MNRFDDRRAKSIFLWEMLENDKISYVNVSQVVYYTIKRILYDPLMKPNLWNRR